MDGRVRLPGFTVNAFNNFFIYIYSHSLAANFKNMLNDDTENKIQDIISGTYIHWQTDTCTAARNFLCSSFSPSTTVKKDFENRAVIKEEQAAALILYINENQLWIKRPPETERLLTVGGEAEVYMNTDGRNVIKLNDAVYYSTWLDFFNSILIHNLLFEETHYELLGFVKRNDILQAVLKQAFVISDSPVNLQEVKTFLEYNSFINTRRNDYYNKRLGLILEDIHDQNVIMNSGIIFFIDTVFYVDLLGKLD
jgi:Serine/Threonine/Tyrosine Kinase found in polyvalent proteins